MVKSPVFWACSVVISLLLDSCCAQKMNVHWGPQSMMYLKGKYGRRFVSEDENRVLKQTLQAWYELLRDAQRLHSLQVSRPGHTLTSKILQDR